MRPVPSPDTTNANTAANTAVIVGTAASTCRRRDPWLMTNVGANAPLPLHLYFMVKYEEHIQR